MRLIGSEGVFHRYAVAKIDTKVGVVRVVCMAGQACFLNGGIIIVTVVVNADDSVSALKQAQG